MPLTTFSNNKEGALPSLGHQSSAHLLRAIDDALKQERWRLAVVGADQAPVRRYGRQLVREQPRVQRHQVAACGLVLEPRKVRVRRQLCY